METLEIYRPMIQAVILENWGKPIAQVRDELNRANPQAVKSSGGKWVVWNCEAEKILRKYHPAFPKPTAADFQKRCDGEAHPFPVVREFAPLGEAKNMACFVCEDERRAGRWIPENHCPNCREAPNAPTDAPRPKPRPWMPGEQLTFFQVDGFLPETA